MSEEKTDENKETLDELLEILRDRYDRILEGWFSVRGKYDHVHDFYPVEDFIPPYRTAIQNWRIVKIPRFIERAGLSIQTDEGAARISFTLISDRRITDLAVIGSQSYGSDYFRGKHYGSIVPNSSALQSAAKLIAADDNLIYGSYQHYAREPAFHTHNGLRPVTVPDAIQRVLHAQNRLNAVIIGIQNKKQQGLDEEAKKLLQYAPLKDT